MMRTRWFAALVVAAVASLRGRWLRPRRPRGAIGPVGVGSSSRGAASRSVLPLVDGSLDCTRAGFPSADDAVSPGMFVPEWDDGRIAVGNGDAESHWVHDDVRVGALGLREPSAKDVTVLLAADLYMIVRVDADSIRAKVPDRRPLRPALRHEPQRGGRAQPGRRCRRDAGRRRWSRRPRLARVDRARGLPALPRGTRRPPRPAGRRDAASPPTTAPGLRSANEVYAPTGTLGRRPTSIWPRIMGGPFRRAALPEPSIGRARRDCPVSCVTGRDGHGQVAAWMRSP
jgi:hypothetical protein